MFESLSTGLFSFQEKMEAESGSLSEQCIENNVQNSSSVDEVITNTTYMEHETVASYTHFETHQPSSEILVNNDMSSYNAQEYNMETNVSYPENIDAGTVSNEEAKEVIENEVVEQPQINEVVESIPMEISQDNNVAENIESNFGTEYKLDEIHTENIVNENGSETNIIVEEPVENPEENAQNSEESTNQKIEANSTEITVEEIENTSLPEYDEAIVNQQSSIIITEVEDNVMNFESEKIQGSSCEENKHETSSEVIETTDKVDENIKGSSFDSVEDHSNLAEGI